MREVHPDLVSPTGVQLGPEEIAHRETREHVDVGAGRSSVGAHRHPHDGAAGLGGQRRGKYRLVVAVVAWLGGARQGGLGSARLDKT